MARDQSRSIREWREARGLSEDELAQRVGSDAHTLQDWERDGYDPAAQRGLALAAALDTAVDTISFGHYLRGLALPGCQFLLATRGRDDWGWNARIVEWQADGPVDEHFAARADAGWLESGASATLALDRLERVIRVALQPAGHS